VRVLVRRDSPSSQLVQQGLATSAEELIEAGARPVHGDLRDRASLDVAVEGVETLVTSANSAFRGGADDPQSVDLKGNRNLIEAARDAGVGHFIFVSLLGADPDHPAPFMQAKARSESALRESGMDHTILAPTAFMEVWPAMVVGMPVLQGQTVTLVGEGSRRHSFVSNRDVAAFAVAAVDNAAAHNQHLAIGGPEALTWREVVATYERVLERSIPV
jgi:NADH dehydrogenase